MIRKIFGPFRFTCGHTKWNEKTVCFGFGKGYDTNMQEWYYFIGLCLYFVYANVGIRKGWWRQREEKKHEMLFD